jgi:hypothetical protein
MMFVSAAMQAVIIEAQGRAMRASEPALSD